MDNKLIKIPNKKIAQEMIENATYIKVSDTGQEGDYIVKITKELWIQIAEIIEKSERKINNE